MPAPMVRPIPAVVQTPAAVVRPLIWLRFVASQMAEAVFNTVTVDIAAGEKKDCILRAGGRTVKFPGYLSIYKDEEEMTDQESIKKKLDKECANKIGDYIKEKFGTGIDLPDEIYFITSQELSRLFKNANIISTEDENLNFSHMQAMHLVAVFLHS